MFFLSRRPRHISLLYLTHRHLPDNEKIGGVVQVRRQDPASTADGRKGERQRIKRNSVHQNHNPWILCSSHRFCFSTKQTVAFLATKYLPGAGGHRFPVEAATSKGYILIFRRNQHFRIVTNTSLCLETSQDDLGRLPPLFFTHKFPVKTAANSKAMLNKQGSTLFFGVLR